MDYQSFIFVHIPKCGGTSLREYLFAAAKNAGIEEDEIYMPGMGCVLPDKDISTLDEAELDVLRAADLKMLASHDGFNIHQSHRLSLKTPFYYVLLREPVKRVVSQYNYTYRHLGKDGLKDVHINDLNAAQLEKILASTANMQLFFLIGSSRFEKIPEKPGKRGRRVVGTCSVLDQPAKKNAAYWADSMWVAEGERLLREEYGAFGILENMAISLEHLRRCAPAWLPFRPETYVKTNETPLPANDEPVREDILAAIRDFNWCDLLLYRKANELLAEKTGGRTAAAPVQKRTGKYQSFLFTHIPRSGGMDFREYIYKAGLQSGIEEAEIHAPGLGNFSCDQNLSNLSEAELAKLRLSKPLIFAGHFCFHAHEEFGLNVGNPFYFVLLRCPVGRFVSHYNNALRSRHQGLSLNELGQQDLLKLLRARLNPQLMYCTNARYCTLRSENRLQKVLRLGRKLFHKLPPPIVKFDERWLRQGIRNLEQGYGAFGIVEKMEASLERLRAAAPEWLQFSRARFQPEPENKPFDGDEPLDGRVLALIRQHHYFDLKLYESALSIFDKQ